jgi:hypothetical protein
MRTRALVATLLVLGVVPALAATNPVSCSPGTVARLKFNPGRTTMSFKGEFTTPPGFDPNNNGLTLDLWTEPETEPLNTFFTATLDGSDIFPRPNGQLRYRDPAGTQNGVTLVKIQPRPTTGTTRITIKRKGAALTVPPGGVFRMVLTSGSTCVRHCGSSCALLPSTKLSCQKSTDTALCGYKSGCEMMNTSSGMCLFPYPSSAFLKDDVTTPTGKKQDYRELAMPLGAVGFHMSPANWNAQLDGFSPGTMMLVNFPQGVDTTLSGVNTWQNYAPSVNPVSSPTILLDADTGELIEHFSENDITSFARAGGSRTAATTSSPSATSWRWVDRRSSPSPPSRRCGTARRRATIWSSRAARPTSSCSTRWKTRASHAAI